MDLLRILFQGQPLLVSALGQGNPVENGRSHETRHVTASLDSSSSRSTPKLQGAAANFTTTRGKEHNPASRMTIPLKGEPVAPKPIPKQRSLLSSTPPSEPSTPVPKPTTTPRSAATPRFTLQTAEVQKSIDQTTAAFSDEEAKSPTAASPTNGNVRIRKDEAQKSSQVEVAAAPLRRREAPPAAPQQTQEATWLEFSTGPTIAQNSFDDMGFHDCLLRGVYAYGFETPTALQSQLIPLARRAAAEGRDVFLAGCPIGCGKTVGIAIATLSMLDYELRATQVLTLAPSRELAQQVTAVYNALGEYLGILHHNRRVATCCVGGSSVQAAIRDFNSSDGRPPLIVVGSPGRLLDFLRRGVLRPEGIRHVVFEEADELLVKPFFSDLRDTIYEILRYVPPTVQCFVNLSVPEADEDFDLFKKFLRNPYGLCLAESTNSSRRSSSQRQAAAEPRLKNLPLTYDLSTLLPPTMQHCFGKLPNESALSLYLFSTLAARSEMGIMVFVNHTQEVESLYSALNCHGMLPGLAFFHSDIPFGEREQILRGFRSGSVRILITTDALSHGIDIQQVGLVINVRCPVSLSTYIHRAGRACRCRRPGACLTIGPEMSDFINYSLMMRNSGITHRVMEYGQPMMM